MKKFLKFKNAQTAIEYMLVFAVVVAIIVVGFRSYLERTHHAEEIFYNGVARGIYGEPPP